MAISKGQVYDKLQRLRDTIDDSTIVDILAIKFSTDMLNEAIDDVAKDLDLEL